MRGLLFTAAHLLLLPPLFRALAAAAAAATSSGPARGTNRLDAEAQSRAMRRFVLKRVVRHGGEPSRSGGAVTKTRSSITGAGEGTKRPPSVRRWRLDCRRRPGRLIRRRGADEAISGDAPRSAFAGLWRGAPLKWIFNWIPAQSAQRAPTFAARNNGRPRRDAPPRPLKRTRPSRSSHAEPPSMGSPEEAKKVPAPECNPRRAQLRSGGTGREATPK